MKRPITDKQAEVLAFCADFFAGNDQLPTAQVIADRFGWSSANAAWQMLEALHRKGYLARNALHKFKFTDKARPLIPEREAVTQ
jgi:SOS-response transcriptional repressor LexA